MLPFLVASNWIMPSGQKREQILQPVHFSVKTGSAVRHAFVGAPFTLFPEMETGENGMGRDLFFFLEDGVVGGIVTF